MRQLLDTGQVVRTEFSAQPCTAEQLLGAGGQGEVYRANLSGTPVALKWLYPETATDVQRTIIRTLIRRGAPSDRFLWPIDLTTAEAMPGFGYLMPLLETRYCSFHDLMTRRVDPTFRVLTSLGLELAHSYLQLHAKGWCYRDISWNNIFFDPETGEVLIGDNDNVTVDGDTNVTVSGTQRFMAPEIVRGSAVPSTRTDLHSLAVVLFYVLMMNSPFEGKREQALHALDGAALTHLYGTDPVFIFDPNEDSNRPVPGVHDNALVFWPIYPRYIRDLFIQAFTRGLRDPQFRVMESEWRSAFVRLRDAIFRCGQCGAENFYDIEAMLAAGCHVGRCWNEDCTAELTLPPRLRADGQVVMLNADTQLFPHHFDDEQLYVFAPPVAQVTRHPTDPGVWGLRNLASTPWTCIAPDGATREVGPGQSVRLIRGLQIRVGRRTCEIDV